MSFLILVFYIVTFKNTFFLMTCVKHQLFITLNNHTIENRTIKICTLPGQIMDPETPGIYQDKLYVRLSKCFLK